MTRQDSNKELCLNLLKEDTEEQVINLLHQAGYWDNPDVWLPYGGRDNNFNTIGNQSSVADSALVEKIINSVDAVLMGECGLSGIQPSSPNAPQSISEAVAQYFGDNRSTVHSMGHISNWSNQKRRKESNRITVATTGAKQKPSITIVDDGEGQTPESLPNTLLSLDKQNKIDVNFVQGKFNMGGTGALRFCGDHNLQLVISRRNPSLLPNRTPDGLSECWGFTVVRREDPTDAKRLSTYKYLAPNAGRVLSFQSDALPLFPEANTAYIRETGWGTAVKLFEYKMQGSSHILRKGGLLQRLDLLLPKIALPIRLHECRDYKGHAGSFDTTLSGLSVRLHDDRSDNLEPGFPTSGVLTIRGEKMTTEIFAFKHGKADAYKKSEGIIFVVNGQTHGTLPNMFFNRRSVGMDRLRDSILVIVDCSGISGRSREDLFMNSRDRMEHGELLGAIEHDLVLNLKDNQNLRDLKERRRRELAEAQLKDSKPLKEVLESVLRKSPAMAAILGGKGRLPDPFRPSTVKPDHPFQGSQYPSFFRFKGKRYGHELRRTTAINMRSRIVFETDVENTYFSRSQDTGQYDLRIPDSELHLNGMSPSHTLNLQDGVATLNMSLPASVEVGDSFQCELSVHDETMAESFVNSFMITVGPFQQPSGRPVKPTPPKRPQGLDIPELVRVYEEQWETHKFDKYSALKVVHDQLGDDLASEFYTFYINMDNVYLKTELKATKEHLEVVNEKWVCGMVLVGMALLQNDTNTEPSESESGEGDPRNRYDVAPEDEVYRVTKSIGPILLPMIGDLGALASDTADGSN